MLRLSYMFDNSKIGQPDNIHQTSNWNGITKCENGYTVECNGITRVYTDLETALADLKAYLQTPV